MCWRRDRLPTPVFLGFPCGSAGKESTCSVGDLDSIPGLGRFPGEGKGYPLQDSGLENSMDCLVHGVAKSQTRLESERLSPSPIYPKSTFIALHFSWLLLRSLFLRAGLSLSHTMKPFLTLLSEVNLWLYCCQNIYCSLKITIIFCLRPWSLVLCPYKIRLGILGS